MTMYTIPPNVCRANVVHAPNHSTHAHSNVSMTRRKRSRDLNFRTSTWVKLVTPWEHAFAYFRNK